MPYVLRQTFPDHSPVVQDIRPFKLTENPKDLTVAPPKGTAALNIESVISMSRRLPCL